MPPRESAPSGSINHQLSTLNYRAWLSAALLVLMTFLAYLPVWHAGFIWDDDTFLVDNPLIKAGNGLYQFWFTTAAPDYFPMTSTSLWLEWRLWGGQPLGFHLVNVLLHSASSVLLWRVLLRLKIPGAWLAGAIFALHPVNAESVAWITERKNTLTMFFYLLAVLWYLRSERFEVRSEKAEGGSERGEGRRAKSERDWLSTNNYQLSTLWYGLSLVAFALALFSKTAVVGLPVVLLGLAWWRRGRIERRDVWRSIPFFVMAGLLAVVTAWFQSQRAIGADIVRTDSFLTRLAGAGWAVWFYLYKDLLPLNLVFVYPRWSINVANPLSYVPGLLVVAALALCWHYRRSWGRPLLFTLGYFVVMLLPVLGFLNIYFMRYTLVADHWQYFPILGPITLVAAALTTGCKSKPRLGFALGIALLVVLGALTWKQAHIFENRQMLWRDTLAKNPGSWMAHNNLGNDLLEEGRIDEAMDQFQTTLRLNPAYSDAHYNLGTAFQDKDRIDEAMGEYEEAVRLDPKNAKACYNLGTILQKKGEADRAIDEYRAAILARPDYADAHFNLGISLGKQGRLDEALGEFEEAVRLNPGDFQSHVELSRALTTKGRLDEAIGQYEMAIQLKPGDAEARNSLGILLAMQGRLDDAIGQFQEAIRLEPDYADAHRNLAHALEKKSAPAGR